MTATLPAPVRKKQENILWRRFRKSTPGKVGAVIVLVFVLLALLAPVIRPYNPSGDVDYRFRLSPPRLEFRTRECAARQAAGRRSCRWHRPATPSRHPQRGAVSLLPAEQRGQLGWRASR